MSATASYHERSKYHDQRKNLAVISGFDHTLSNGDAIDQDSRKNKETH